MKCPRCQNPDLKPTLIEEYLPAMGCETCHGSLVSLLYYRHWAETQKLARAQRLRRRRAPDRLQPATRLPHCICPKCARVMAKYKLTGTVANRVDVCSTCDEAWLDQRRMGTAGSAAAEPRVAGDPHGRVAAAHPPRAVRRRRAARSSSA